MGSYIPSTMEERQEMLSIIGCKTLDEMYKVIPESVKVNGKLDLPCGLSEMVVLKEMSNLSLKNKIFKDIFRGAGAYNHYIPSIVKFITSKEEFVTSYTPYQAELSQGVLQSIFEYQTSICELMNMDVSNASVYDGANAAAEAAAMCRDRKRTITLVSETSSPETINTIKTYCLGSDTEVVIVPQKDGVTDIEALKNLLNKNVSGFFVQQPNYYGQLEDCVKLGEIVHEAGAKYIMGCNPISLGLIKTPGECGADVAIAEGQPLGIPLSFGGPYLGIMTCTNKMLRKIPGRIVGETVDADGKRAFVLTLQAREQHIRREKASSNICSNQALCAMTASVYLATVGAQGIQDVAKQCISKSHYAQKSICSIKGFDLKYTGEFFNEFVTACPGNVEEFSRKLEDKGILGGLPIKIQDKDYILWCVTEVNAKEDIDNLVKVIEEVATQWN